MEDGRTSARHHDTTRAGAYAGSKPVDTRKGEWAKRGKGEGRADGVDDLGANWFICREVSR